MLTNDDVLFALPLARRRRASRRAAPEGGATRGRAEPAPARVPGLLGRVHLAARSGTARCLAPAAAQDRREARRRRGAPRDRHRLAQHPFPAELVEADVALRLDDLDTARDLYERALKTSADPARRRRRSGASAGSRSARAIRAQAVDSIEEALRWRPRSRPRPRVSSGRSARPTPRRASSSRRSASSSAEAAAAAEAGDSLEQARCEIGLANAHIDSGNFGRAEELLGGALARTPATVDPAQRARIYWSQSRLHTLKGNQDAAARYARKTLELLELGEDTYNTACAHQLLAFIAVERGRGEEALGYVSRGLALLGDGAARVETAQFRIEEARALVLLGRTDEAAAAAMTVQGLLADAEPDDAGRAYIVLGDVYRQVGDTAHAREIWELAAELLEREPNPYIARRLRTAGHAAGGGGRTEEALQMLKRAYGARQRTESN